MLDGHTSTCFNAAALLAKNSILVHVHIAASCCWIGYAFSREIERDVPGSACHAPPLNGVIEQSCVYVLPEY